MAQDQQHGRAEETLGGADENLANISAVDIADWRLRTFALYANVRKLALENPAEAHSYWRHQ
ncbi:MAG: hypothetical protein JWQ56_1966, partial [Pseudarthrobacter sp.]|nr:hypothetical protein [Pseudarthrobacter sp.]